jgi:hypothetical protein
MTEAAAISVTAKPVDDTQTVAEIETTPFISIVLPCLNEDDGVGVCVRKARGWLNRSGYSGEVVVVDNGSTDRSV